MEQERIDDTAKAIKFMDALINERHDLAPTVAMTVKAAWEGYDEGNPSSMIRTLMLLMNELTEEEMAKYEAAFP